MTSSVRQVSVLTFLPHSVFISLLFSPEKFSAAMHPQMLLDLLQVESQKIEEESEVSLRFETISSSSD